MATETITRCDICKEIIPDGKFVGKVQIYEKDNNKLFSEVCPACISKFEILIGNLIPINETTS